MSYSAGIWFPPGGTQGGFNLDAGYDGQGDPHGSIATIEVCVYNALANSDSAPDVRILVGDAQSNSSGANGRVIPVYSSQSAFALQRTDLAAWVILEVLRRLGVSSSNIDIASVIAYAAICAGSVSYTSISGRARRIDAMQSRWLSIPARNTTLNTDSKAAHCKTI
jgi:hypothetical protein